MSEHRKWLVGVIILPIVLAIFGSPYIFDWYKQREAVTTRIDSSSVGGSSRHDQGVPSSSADKSRADIKDKGARRAGLGLRKPGAQEPPTSRRDDSSSAVEDQASDNQASLTKSDPQEPVTEPEPEPLISTFQGSVDVVTGKLVEDIDRSTITQLSLDANIDDVPLDDLQFSGMRTPGLSKGSLVTVLRKGSVLFSINGKGCQYMSLCDSDEAIPLDSNGALTKNLVLDANRDIWFTASYVGDVPFVPNKVRLNIGYNVRRLLGSKKLQYDGKWSVLKDNQNENYSNFTGYVRIQGKTKPDPEHWFASIELTDGKSQKVSGRSGYAPQNLDYGSSEEFKGRMLSYSRNLSLRLTVE